MRPGASRLFVSRFGSLVVLLNVLVAALSLGNICILASGGVSVELPDEDDFSWHLDPPLFALAMFTAGANFAHDCMEYLLRRTDAGRLSSPCG
ncbi:MAG: hypothetical protein FJ149_12190 [Euryarchaeota archaeon]|nr:hypothetical protein [Euryarchaeota archaeon]